MSDTPDGDATPELAAARDAAWAPAHARASLEWFGRPDEFGALACFLASAASSYITGADLPLDGGGTAG